MSATRLASVQEQRIPPNAPGGPVVGVANGDPRATSPTPTEDARASSTKVCVGTCPPGPTPMLTSVPKPLVTYTNILKTHQPLSHKRTPTSLWSVLDGWSRILRNIFSFEHYKQNCFSWIYGVHVYYRFFISGLWFRFIKKIWSYLLKVSLILRFALVSLVVYHTVDFWNGIIKITEHRLWKMFHISFTLDFNYSIRKWVYVVNQRN